MRLDEALRETGKAVSHYNRIARHANTGVVEVKTMDGGWRPLHFEDLVETWVPYHDPPKEPETIALERNVHTVRCYGGKMSYACVACSPERDEIVKAAVAWVASFDGDVDASWRISASTKPLEAAVEAWERAGRPA